MQIHLAQAIEHTIAESTGVPAAITSKRTMQGGCINQTEVIQLSDGREFFLKLNSEAASDLFAREADGLAALAAVEAIRVPTVVGYGAENASQFLVLEFIEPGNRSPNFFQQFGHQLAELHRHGTHHQFGFHNDNYLGSTNQPNDWFGSWLDFWRTNRFGFQFRLAESKRLADAHFMQLADRLLNRLDDLLSVDEPVSLLHGDLWSGNFIRGRAGEPVLIDPAVYYGHREAEFGMTTLFGGFDQTFYSAYQESWPMLEGWEQRVEIYRLYHVLNHLNLFGASYHAQCVEIMKKYA